jgi:type I restriction enzyme S subunit
MSEKNLIPELRFPAFEKDGEWTVSSIDKLCDILNNIRKPVTSTNRTAGPYPYYGASGIIDFIDKFLFDERLLLIGEDGAKWGAYDNTAFLVEGKYWVNNHAHVLKPIGIDEKLLESYLVKLDLNPYITGAAPPKLTLRKLKEIPVPVPSTPEEQQKIASCLSSLDELIAAHKDKLDALKDHKKGLLQNLFPQEGETVPKLRFPEFEGDGEWIETSLSEISPSIFDGTHQTPKYTDDGIPFFSVENIVSGTKNKFISREDYIEATKKNKPEEGDVLVTRIGSIGIPKVVDWDYEFSIYVTLAVIKKSDQFISQYLASYIQSSRFQKEILRRSLLKAAPQKINMNELRECEILLPPDEDKQEQQKIASCLSALDELITAQQEKIAQLQQHKKGLMQGLFPKTITN